MFLATSITLGNTLVVTVGVLLAVPSCLLTVLNIKDRADRRDERRINEIVAKQIVGEHILTDPQRAERDVKATPSLTTTLEAVAHQMTPSNGKTVAQTIETVRAEMREVNKEMMQLAVLWGEHMSDGHGAQTWPSSP